MQPLLRVEDLKKYFPAGARNLLGKHKHNLKAVDGISFTINEGEIFGLVGESGCGKSTTGRCLLRITEPTSGDVFFKNKEISKLNKTESKQLSKEIQMIFQNPHSSLNPRMTIKQTLDEVLTVHKYGNKAARNKRIEELLDMVGIPTNSVSRYPHEFSGGQLQRIVIARALALDPEFIFADEPVASLDVSIQAQILNLLAELREKLDLTILFVAHDLSVVEHISDRIGVMYLGKIVEIANVEELYADTSHPYTEALISAIPIDNPKEKKEEIMLKGDIPSPINPPKGCRFASRCRHAFARCKEEEPLLKEIKTDHFVACHLHD